MRYLCLSDIHGHVDALSAVLATAERRGYQRVIVTGDICFPGPAPLRTWQRLQQLQAICVQGVGDRAIATVETQVLRPRSDFEAERLQRLIAVREELGPRILSQLAKLPPMVARPLAGGGRLVAVHGCPADPLEPMTHDMDDAEIAAALGLDPATIVVCGGSHVPFDRTVARKLEPDGPVVETRVIGLGSVGEAPAGVRRFAHAAFVATGDNGIEVEQFAVPLGKAA